MFLKIMQFAIQVADILPLLTFSLDEPKIIGIIDIL